MRKSLANVPYAVKWQNKYLWTWCTF